jgi:hypothetical protein
MKPIGMLIAFVHMNTLAARRNFLYLIQLKGKTFMGSLRTKEVRYVSDCRVQMSNVLIRANDEGSSPHFE